MALLLLAELTVLLGDRAAAQVARPFTARFRARDTGELLLTGNSTVRCSPGDSGCAAVPAASAPTSALGAGRPAAVDEDDDPSTSTSSRAALALPDGGQVLWAGLYWSGLSSAEARGQVRFAGPGLSYAILAASQLDVVDTDRGPAYQGFVEVTDRVRAGGAGVYTAADVSSATGAVGAYGGWALVVAVRDPAAPVRDLTVFDGFVALGAGGAPALTVTASGFTTAAAGPVGAQVGAVTYGGGPGSSGDRLSIADHDVSDVANPPGDLFNGSVAGAGVPLAGYPADQAAPGSIDIDRVVAPPGAVPNGTSSVPLLVGSTDDRLLAGVLTSAIDDPGAHLAASATGWDANGGPLEAGDTVAYAIAVSNRGTTAADGVTLGLPVPDGARYLPGTLTLAGAATSALSDEADADTAEYEAARGRLVGRVGAGADAAGGGRIEPGETTTLGFQVRVDQPLPRGGRLALQGELSYRDAVEGRQLLVPTDDPAGNGGFDATLTPVNTAPTAVADQAATVGTDPVTVDVLANDGDAEGDLLIVGGVGPADVGSAQCSPAGLCTYRAPSGSVGTSSFAYTAVDVLGLRSLGRVTVAVAAPPEPEAPPLPPAGPPPPGAPLPLAPPVSADLPDTADPLVSAVPPAGAGVERAAPVAKAPAVSPAAVPGAAAGAAAGSTPPRCEAPTTGAPTCVAGVSLSLAQGSQAPRAVDDTVNVEAGQRAVLRVLDNDVDPDGDLVPASLRVVRAPARGSAEATSDGVIRYTPYAGLAGNDELSYRICDAGERCAEAVVRLVVSVPQLPASGSPTTAPATSATSPSPSPSPSTTAARGSATGSTVADGRLAGTGARTAQPATVAALLIGVGLLLVGAGDRSPPARHQLRQRRGRRRRRGRRAGHRRRGPWAATGHGWAPTA